LKLVTVPPNTLQVPHAFRSWSQNDDSLFVGLSTGFVGTSSRLAKTDEGWVGQARTFSDMGDALQFERRIELRPVGCDTPPLEPASLDEVLLRGIDVAGGQRLELGELVPTEVKLESASSRTWTVIAEATGPLAGHDALVIHRTPDHIVHHIELHYPVGFDLTAISEWLSSVRLPNRVLGENEVWMNRTTWIAVQRGSRPRVLLRDRRYF
jgi:hypothetical protein